MARAVNTERSGAMLGGRLGADSGSHPVGVPYPNGGGATYNGVTSRASPGAYMKFPAMVKLYEDSAGRRGVECTSCHDIHQRSNAKHLLRDAPRTLCTRCHIV